MFTPEDISRSDLIEDDQPYAGWLYLGASVVAEKTSGERPYLDNLEINIGMIGPAAQAEVIQTEVHRIKGVQLIGPMVIFGVSRLILCLARDLPLAMYTHTGQWGPPFESAVICRGIMVLL
jgi:hypothetical protein